MRKRYSAMGLSRLRSTSAASASRSASQTSSAAASGKRPAKTDKRARSRFDSSSSGSYLHSIVAGNVRWRSGAARASGEKRQRTIEPLQEHLRAEELRSRCGELDRERQAVEVAADRFDARVRRKGPADPTGSFDEQRHRIVRGQRLERVLALPREPQGCPARDEHAQSVGGGEERPEVRRSRKQVLEVVEQEQELLPAQIAEKVVAGRQCLSDLRQEELGVREAGERDPEDAVRDGADELGRDLEGEAGLARAAGPRDRHQAGLLRVQFQKLLELLFPAEERARSNRQVRGIEGPKWRKLAVPELVEPLWLGEILQP